MGLEEECMAIMACIWNVSTAHGLHTQSPAPNNDVKVARPSEVGLAGGRSLLYLLEATVEFLSPGPHHAKGAVAS